MNLVTIVASHLTFFLVCVYTGNSVNVLPDVTHNEVNKKKETIGMYTYNSIKTTLEISTGKSSLMTFSMGRYEDNHVEYLVKAATNNNKMQKQTETILVDVWQDEQNLELTGMNSSNILERAAHKANLLYPGTIQGLVLNRKGSNLLERSSKSSLCLGTRLSCSKNLEEDGAIDKEVTLVKNLDFVLCELKLESETYKNRNETIVDTIGSKFLKLADYWKQFKSTLDVIGFVKLPNSSLAIFEDLNVLATSPEELSNLKNSTLLFIDVVSTPEPHYFRLSFYYEGLFKLSVMPNILRSKIHLAYVLENPGQSLSSATAATIVTGSLILVILFISGIIKHAKDLKQANLQQHENFPKVSGVEESKTFTEGDGDTKEVSNRLGFPYDTSLEITWNELDIDYKALLGRGNFGYVFKATIKSEPGSEVALKLAGIDNHRSSLMRMISEIKILTMLGSHELIVKLKGIYTAGLSDGVVYLATEICGLGNLQNHLRKDQPYNKPMSRIDLSEETTSMEMKATAEAVTFQEMVHWSSEIACGMEFIGNKNIIHADLAARNVLLTLEKTAKICDFGLSRCVESDTNWNIRSHDEPLPWRWMAIETLRRNEYSVQSDVWSYGVTLWEIFSHGDAPYPIDRPNKEFINGLLCGRRLSCPPQATAEIYGIMNQCWSSEPSKRPSFKEMTKQFSRIANNLFETKC